LAAGRRAAVGFFARAGVVAAIVVFLVTVVHLDARRMPARSFLIPTRPGWTAEPDVLTDTG
jgi:hypothetical protein